MKNCVSEYTFKCRSYCENCKDGWTNGFKHSLNITGLVINIILGLAVTAGFCYGTFGEVNIKEKLYLYVNICLIFTL